MHIKECFEILELKFDASLEQVKKAYKKLMMAFHPDKFQGDPQLKAIAERKAKEINLAREELIHHYKTNKSNDNPDKIIIQGGENYGKVSDFFTEVCRTTGAGGTYHLDLFMAYRSWRAEKDLDAVSIEDLFRALDALKLVSMRKNINGIDSIFWPGLEISKAWLFDDLDDLWVYDPHDLGIGRF
jgi:hypothetical protein